MVTVTMIKEVATEEELAVKAIQKCRNSITICLKIPVKVLIDRALELKVATVANMTKWTKFREETRNIGAATRIRSMATIITIKVTGFLISNGSLLTKARCITPQIQVVHLKTSLDSRLYPLHIILRLLVATIVGDICTSNSSSRISSTTISQSKLNSSNRTLEVTIKLLKMR